MTTATWTRAARGVARRFYSLPTLTPAFCHHETTYPTVVTLSDALKGPPLTPYPKHPVFQTMTTSGDCLLPQTNNTDDRNSETTNDILRKVLISMIRLRAFDETFKAAQRQGRLSFFLESRGEEAAVVASAAALEPDDDIFSQYREHGALLWRGASFEALAHQCCGTRDDSAKGRQMPVHYGDRSRNFHTVSSPLATQLLHAVGFAYANKIKRMQSDACEETQIESSPSSQSLSKPMSVVACYFGDGTSSEGDFHAALNFASILRCPVVFICRNNGYAISTPTSQQFGGDGVVSRAEGYGMASCRVDGGDSRAVYLATRAARQHAVTTSRPILLELMTYRLGDHSTSDDCRNYVPQGVLDRGEREGDPIGRLSRLLSATDAEQAAVRDAAVLEARQAIDLASRTATPSVEIMFDDVYDDQGSQSCYELSRQRRELLGGVGRGSHGDGGEVDDDEAVQVQVFVPETSGES